MMSAWIIEHKDCRRPDGVGAEVHRSHKDARDFKSVVCFYASRYVHSGCRIVRYESVSSRRGEQRKKKT